MSVDLEAIRTQAEEESRTIRVFVAEHFDRFSSGLPSRAWLSAKAETIDALLAEVERLTAENTALGMRWQEQYDRAEALAEVERAARADGLAECWSPAMKMVDEGGHLEEVDCGDCGPCDLAAALASLDGSDS